MKTLRTLECSPLVSSSRSAPVGQTASQGWPGTDPNGWRLVPASHPVTPVVSGRQAVSLFANGAFFADVETDHLTHKPYHQRPKEKFL